MAVAKGPFRNPHIVVIACHCSIPGGVLRVPLVLDYKLPHAAPRPNTNPCSPCSQGTARLLAVFPAPWPSSPSVRHGAPVRARCRSTASINTLAVFGEEIVQKVPLHGRAQRDLTQHRDENTATSLPSSVTSDIPSTSGGARGRTQGS